MIKRLLILLGALLLLTVVAAAGAGYWAWQRLHEPFRGFTGEEQLVEVAPGSSVISILRDLETQGVLWNAKLARLFLIHRLGDPALLAGEYRFTEPMSTPEVLAKLARGEVVTHALTLIEGWTLEETAVAIAAGGFGDLDILRAEVWRPDRILDLDPEAENLEGYLYPDTYHFARGTPEAEIVDTLVRTFKRRYQAEATPLIEALGDSATPNDEPADGPKSPLGLRQLVILASIVEKETQLDEERAIVASVYTNRLRIGMGLYADPTIIYAKKLAGTWDGNLRRDDLRLESPYNTYRVPGLPPGPICSPSIKSLLAAIAPADTKFLYFVSKNDGSHVFARTKSEHDRNVYRWQKLFWKQRWAAERASGTR